MSIDTIVQTGDTPQSLDALKALVQEVLELRASVIGEASDDERFGGKRKRADKSSVKAKKGRHDMDDDEKGLARLKKNQEANAARKAEKKLNRGKIRTLKNIPAGHHLDKKTHKVIHSTGKHGNAKFANATTFRSTRSDAHLHTDADCNKGLRGKTSPEMYAKHGSSEELKKHPCKKSYPIFPTPGDRARIAGSARMAAEYKDKPAISKIKAAGEKLGMHIHGNLWNQRPECKEYQRSGHLPTGWTKKDCEPHGEGGADEWLRKFRVHKSREGKLKHAPIMRKRTHFGGGRLPKAHHDDHAYAKGGGHWGEMAVKHGRNLAGHDKMGEPKHSKEGAKWARHKLATTGKKHSAERGHASTGEPKGPGTQVKKNFKHAEPKYKTKAEFKARR